LDDGVVVAKIAKVREKLSDGTQEFEDVEEALEQVVDLETEE
jgi:DNA gyrase subunit A